jgi:two-component system response regulator YesN
MLNLSKILSNVMEEKRYYSFKENIKFKIINSDSYENMWHNINGLLHDMTKELDLQRKDLNGVIIQKCKEFIEENYAEDFTLELIAQKYHFSSAYFGNLFKEYTDLGFSKYLTKVRLKKAQDLLIHTDLGMSEIALKIGISAPAYFNRIFKKEFNISPNKYRQLNAQH